MKKIPLRNRAGVTMREALVDDEDFELYGVFRWCHDPKGYVHRRCKTKKIYLHRLIAGTPPGMQTDHIDGDPLNNTRGNLRVCTIAENLRNRPKQKNNTSGAKGISWSKRAKKWDVRINANGHQVWLGVYSSLDDALKVYSGAEMKYHGDFAPIRREA